MAITRSQQAKQMLQNGGMLVQPSMTGKRPGYRGDAAARSTGAAQSGRADPGERGDPGEGANKAGFSAPTRGEPAFTSPDRFVKITDDQINQAKDFRALQKFKSNLANQMDIPLGPFQFILNKVMKPNFKYRNEFLKNNPQLKEYLESLDEDDQKKAMVALADVPNVSGQNFEDFLAFDKGAPALKYKGNVGGLEKFVSSYEMNPDGTFKLSPRGYKIAKTYGYRDKPDGNDAYIFPRSGIMAQAPEEKEEKKEEDDDPVNLRLLAEGGRAGFQEGGGIEQRLEQLGGDVTSAEQMLQGINKRLETAESSLGSGGGFNSLQQPQPGIIPVQQPIGQPPAGGIGGLIPRPGSLGPNNFNRPVAIRPENPQVGQEFMGNTILAVGDNSITYKTGGGANNLENAGLIPEAPNNPKLFGYDPRGIFNVQDAFSAAQQAAQEQRKSGFAGKVVLPGEMSFEDFSNLYDQGRLQPLRAAGSDSLAFPNLESLGEQKDFIPMRGGAQMMGLAGIPAAGYADGGDVVGGEYDFESARQAYGLGKLVKKVTRTVKKIAKSPVGKAALIGGGGYLLGGGIIPGVSGKFLPFAKYGSSAGSGFGFGNILPNILNIAKMPGLAEKAFSMGTAGKALTGIAAASALAGLLTPAQEKQAQELAEEEGIDIEAARNSILARAQGNIPGDLRATAFLAEGGKPEPVAKKTMPLLDMGGKEMDLREEGGFVPIGRMEKADDVPARLSKNEFVFTADAVRNAGDGDVDKGAEVMYNMMKNLEAGGEVSEESQGLEGARKMFQTSQRLEEVL